MAEQLSFWKWVCKCGGVIEDHPTYKKEWGRTKDYKICYKCMSVYDEQFNPVQAKVRRVVKQI